MGIAFSTASASQIKTCYSDCNKESCNNQISSMSQIVVQTTSALMVLLLLLESQTRAVGVSAFVSAPTNRIPTTRTGRTRTAGIKTQPTTSSLFSTFTPSGIYNETVTTQSANPRGDNTRSARDEAVRRRAATAKDTWSTIALEPTRDRIRHKIDLLDPTSGKVKVLRDPALFEEFATTVKGTYFVNGLSSCQIGDRLVHPFEAHGYCKSFVLDGNGSLEVTSRIVETPLAKTERQSGRVVRRGVMSTVVPNDNLWGVLQNGLSSSDRDTANLTADLWPPPKKNKQSGDHTESSAIDPLLIVTTDNGEPYAIDPETLEMKGRLCDVVPKLAAVFDPLQFDVNKITTDGKSKFLAHTRYDAKRNRFVMVINTMVLPGENLKGNAQMEFLEFDENFDVVSRRKHTTRFMVFHDWVLTQNYYVVPKNPAYLKWKHILRFAVGASLGTEVFAMEEDARAGFILIPRFDPDEPVREIASDKFFNCFHFGPSFETDENEMIVHACVFDHYEFGGEMGFDLVSQEFDPIAWGCPSEGGLAPPPQLDKFVIDLETFEMKEKTRLPVIPVDMPNFGGDAMPQKRSYFLGASRPEGWFPFHQIVKLDLETHESIVYDAGEHQIASEPMLVPRPKKNQDHNGNDDCDDDDDDFVMSIIHNAKEKDTRLTIWESKTFEKGPIAEVSLDILFPWCVHGSFYPDYNPYTHLTK